MQSSSKIHDELAIVSPHLDDAAFSCGIVLQAAIEITSVKIVNIFTRSAYSPFAPETERCGIEAVTELRRQEDARCLHLLQAKVRDSACLTVFDLGLLDAPLRLRLRTDDVQGHPLDADHYEREVESLAAVLHPMLRDATCIVLPLGLGGRGLEGHIDHRVTRDAGCQCVAPDRISFYEDLPYAARMSRDDRDSAIRAFISSLADVQPVLINHADGEKQKIRLMQSYASQVDATTIEEMAVYTSRSGGERLYAAAKARGILETFSR